MSKSFRPSSSTIPSSSSAPLDLSGFPSLGSSPGGGNSAMLSTLGLSSAPPPRSWASIASTSTSPGRSPSASTSAPSTSSTSTSSTSGPSSPSSTSASSSSGSGWGRASSRADLAYPGGPFHGPSVFPDTGSDGEEHLFRPLYHATARRYADSIQSGIDLSQSRPNLDFNPRGKGGFYTTADLGQAEEWAARQGSGFVGDRGVVLEYAVQQDLLNSMNGRVFDTSWSSNRHGGYSQRFPTYDDREDWQDFVYDGRKGRLNHSYDFVEGPMLSNPNTMRGPDDVRSKGHQLALFSDPVVKLFEGPTTRKQRLDL